MQVRDGGAPTKCLTQGAARDDAARRVRQLAVVLLDFGEHESNVNGLLAAANDRRGHGEPAAEIVVVEVWGLDTEITTR